MSDDSNIETQILMLDEVELSNIKIMEEKNRPLSLSQLLECTKLVRQSFPGTGKWSVTRMAATPQAKSFALQARFESIDNPYMRYYDTSLIIHEVEFLERKDDKHPLNLTANGKTVFFSQPTFDNSVSVVCTCVDFYHNCRTPVAKANSLAHDYWLDPANQQRIEEQLPLLSELGLPENPQQVPEICSHLAKLVMEMGHRGFLVRSGTERGSYKPARVETPRIPWSGIINTVSCLTLGGLALKMLFPGKDK